MEIGKVMTQISDSEFEGLMTVSLGGYIYMKANLKVCVCVCVCAYGEGLFCVNRENVCQYVNHQNLYE